MCGIAGYFATTSERAPHRVALAVMALEMERRGTHSWGVMTANGDIYKGLGAARDGLTFPAEMPRAMAIHTRYATTGVISIENAHPFTAHGPKGAVIGVHNGMILNHAELNERHRREFAVDSMHIFEDIAHGVSLDEVTGYGAIVYMHDGAWHIGRFNGGELHIVATDGGYFFASTLMAVANALRIAGLPCGTQLKLRDGQVYRLDAAGLTPAYRITAGHTVARWDDFAAFDPDIRSANARPITARGKRAANARKGATCETCGTPMGARAYRDIEGTRVCEVCAQSDYGYIDAEDYWQYPSDGGWQCCEGCGQTIPAREDVFYVLPLNCELCRQCFTGEFTTHGLTRLSSI